MTPSLACMPIGHVRDVCDTEPTPQVEGRPCSGVRGAEMSGLFKSHFMQIDDHFCGSAKDP